MLTCWLCWWPRWWKMVDFYCRALGVSGKPITVISEHCVSLHLNMMENTLAICLYAAASGIVQSAWLCYNPAIRTFSLLSHPKPVICAFTPFANTRFGKQVCFTFLYVSTFLKCFESFCWKKNPPCSIEMCSVLWNSVLPYWKSGLTCQQIPQLGHISLNQKVGTALSV